MLLKNKREPYTLLVRHMIARVESLDAARKSLVVMVERTTLSVDGVAGRGCATRSSIIYNCYLA